MCNLPVRKDAIGRWVLSGTKGNAFRHLSLLNKKAKDVDDASAIELEIDCNTGIQKRMIEAWQISEIQLVIIGGEG